MKKLILLALSAAALVTGASAAEAQRWHHGYGYHHRWGHGPYHRHGYWYYRHGHRYHGWR